MPRVSLVHPVDRQVGHNVRRLRRQAGVSQADLAQALGVSFQQVQKYETGANRIGASKLLAIARRLAVPVAVLFEGLGPHATPRAGQGRPGHPLDPGEEAALMAAFRRLPPQVRQRMVTLLDDLAAFGEGT
jgi:transcriptional regulator with XRE-family HTH domain